VTPKYLKGPVSRSGSEPHVRSALPLPKRSAPDNPTAESWCWLSWYLYSTSFWTHAANC